jgi:hypothetical protein
MYQEDPLALTLMGSDKFGPVIEVPLIANRKTFMRDGKV